MDNKDLMIRSLRGLWVGDCIGNLGTLYFAHDILKALDEGIIKFGIENIPTNHQYFQLSDDTEESIVLTTHLYKNKEIKQDELAIEWADRYYTRDPDGERFGYGLMTRKVLKNIYDGVSWRVANQTKPRIEGPSHVDTLVSNIAQGKSLNDSMAVVNADIKRKLEKEPAMKVGSCGNGSAMRVAPLGAYFFDKSPEKIIEQAKLQSEVTHCHPEGIAGAIAVAVMSSFICEWLHNTTHEYDMGHGIGPLGEETSDILYELLLDYVPKGQVYDGIVKAKNLPLDTPIVKLIEVLGNGTHVTCQDTVPLCVFLTIRALTQYKIEEMYEKVMIETCQCFGDVDTNCAIVGGMIGIISPPPAKWVRYCEPMDGVLGAPYVDQQKPHFDKGYNVNKGVLKKVISETRPWDSSDDGIADQALSLWETAKVMSDATRKPQPTFEEVLAARKKELNIV